MSDARSKFKMILNLEKERNKTLKELEAELGFDISFSDEMVMNNAMNVFIKQYKKDLISEVSTWMK